MRLLSLAAFAAFLVVQCSATISLTDDELNGLKDSCWGPSNAVPERQNPGPGSSTEAECQACVQDAYDTSLTQGQAKMYGCWAMCQNSTAMNFGSNTVDGMYADEQCVDCLTSPLIADPYACQTCIFDLPNTVAGLALRKECIDCAKEDPYQGTKKDYFYACAQCTLLTDPTAKQYCKACVQLITSDPNGELSFAFTQTPLDQIPYPAYEFGKCVAAAQSLQALLTGQEDPSGIQSLCYDAFEKFADTTPVPSFFPPRDSCIQCVITSTLPVTLPVNTPNKAYGCAQYCLDPALAHSQNEVDLCTGCINNNRILDPWSCSNCMAVVDSSLSPADREGQMQSCMTCLQNTPYLGNTNYSNYAWACGQCAGVTDLTIRDACYRCIRNQTFDIHNPDDICQCIDSTVNQGLDIPFGMDAMQRSCFANWTVDVLLDNGATDLQLQYMFLNETSFDDADYRAFLESKFGVQWRELHALGGIMPTNGTECLICMGEMVLYQEALGGPDRRYACRQYCEDPTLVLTVGQAQDCITALNCTIKDPVTGVETPMDPWAVQNCMVISTTLGVYPGTTSADIGKVLPNSTIDEQMRAECFDCICSDPGVYPSFPWACGACAQFQNLDARAACFACLQLGGQDPCQCVDDTKAPPPTPPVGCPIGTRTCAGSTSGSCGYPLVLTTITETCGATSPITLSECWTGAAETMAGYVETCNDETYTQNTCTTSVSMLFETLQELLNAMELFYELGYSGVPPNPDGLNIWPAGVGSWPDDDFVNCANLPCGVIMYMYPEDTGISGGNSFQCSAQNGQEALCNIGGPCTPPNLPCGGSVYICQSPLTNQDGDSCKPCVCPAGTSPTPPLANPVVPGDCTCTTTYTCTGGLVQSVPGNNCQPCACPNGKSNTNPLGYPMVPGDCVCTPPVCPTGLVPTNPSDPCVQTCKCPGTMTSTQNPPTSYGQCSCPAGSTQTCSGSTSNCGVRLVLEATRDEGTFVGTDFSASHLGPCWAAAAASMPGYVETCSGDVTVVDGVIKVSMIFDTQAHLEAAIEAFSAAFNWNGVTSTIDRWPTWPNPRFINCAQLPCTTTLKMYQEPVVTYTPSTTVAVNTYFSCADGSPGTTPPFFQTGNSQLPPYSQLGQGDVALKRPDLCNSFNTPPTSNAPGPVCPCTSCPDPGIWRWIGDRPAGGGPPSDILGHYDGTPPTFNTGPSCLQHFPGCQECHGNCCAKKAQNLINAALGTNDPAIRRLAQPECPTSSCPGNALWKNSARANHVGNCGSPKYYFSAGKCQTPPALPGRKLFSSEDLTATTGRELMAASPPSGTVYTSISGPGYCTDIKKPKPGVTYRAFCDYEAYARVADPLNPFYGTLYSSGDYCMSYQGSVQVNHCLGRVACRDTLGNRVDCATAFPNSNVARAQGIDCFADGNSDNWKLCGAEAIRDVCQIDPTKPACEATSTSCDPLPWIKGESGYVGTCPNKDATIPGSSPAAQYGCHGNCDMKDGTCDFNNCLSYTPNTPSSLAHVGSSDLGTTSMMCAGKKITSGGDSGKYDYDDNSIRPNPNNCPFKNDKAKGYYATCVKYNPSCDSSSSTKFCLGQVKCHNALTGAVANCDDASASTRGAEVGIDLWDGIDCIVQKDSALVTHVDGSKGAFNFRICACSIPTFTSFQGSDKYDAISSPA